MAQALATKYRPTNWEDIVEQDSIKKILMKQVETNTCKNTYLFCGATGCGKAQPLTSKVYTPDGYKLMGDIRPGDIVLDGKGNATKVLGVFPQGIRDIYKLSLSDGTSIEVADNHLNRVWRNNTNKQQIETLDLTTLELKALLENSDYNNRFPLFCEVPSLKSFESLELPIDPYLLGCLIGDGSLSNRNFSFTSKDDFILSELNEILDRDYKLHLKHVAQNDYAIVSKHNYTYHFLYKDKDYFSAQKLQEALMTDGYPRIDPNTLLKVINGNAKVTLNKYPELRDKIKLIEKFDNNRNILKNQIAKLKLNVTSDKKFIPKNYLLGSFEQRLALLQGLLDTDGTLTKPTKSKFSGKDIGGFISITTTSLRLTEDLEHLCRSLGCVVSRYISKQKEYTYRYKGIIERRPCKQSYTLRITIPSNIEPFKLPRKISKICNHRFEPRRKVVSVDFDRKDYCQCIYVESPEHTYITDNLTVTHNTTAARAFAFYINKGIGAPIEIDAASNSGVDNVRNIIKSAQERAIDGVYKIYILDECHQFSNAAWNAMLKIIEEPPAYTIFIFCTTDPQKIPATILNRVQRFNFTRISAQGIRNRLDYICRQEGFTNYAETIDYISRICDGGMRDSIALLEKCASYSTELTIDNALIALGNYSYNIFFDLVNALIDGDQAKVVSIMSDYYNQGNDLKLFVDQFLNFAIDVTKYALFKSCDLTRIPSSMEDSLKFATGFDQPEKYYSYLIDKLLELKNMIKADTNVKATVEVMLLQIARCK